MSMQLQRYIPLLGLTGLLLATLNHLTLRGIAATAVGGASTHSRSIKQQEQKTTPTTQQSVPQTKKPNFLVILADDVGTGDLPFYWEGLNTSSVEMPNLKMLADNGVRFKDAHSTPLCAPSRYMVLSGNYPHRGSLPMGTWFIGDHGQFRKNQKSIAEALRSAGYETAAFGKWHIGGKVPPAGRVGSLKTVITQVGHNWSLPLIEGPGDLGFDRSYISAQGVQGPPYTFFRDDYITTMPSDAIMWNAGEYDMPKGISMIRKGFHGEGDPGWDSSNFDMSLVQETEAFIDDHLEQRPDDPFFAYVALGTVHIPHSPPNVYVDGTQVKGKYQTAHLDMLGVMDKVVGSLVSMIEDKNLADDTIIIFASDNGGLQGTDANSSWTGHKTSGPLRGRKGSIYEGGHRIPLIIRHDGRFPAGEKREKLLGLNDLYATICELAGVDVPVGSAQDSVSFKDYIMDEKSSRGLREFLGHFQLGDTFTKPWVHAIRNKDIKLVHYPRANKTEVYNVRDDIGETNDISGKEWIINHKIGPMLQELRAIGPCPSEDRAGVFLVRRIDENHNCKWFRQDSTRCWKHHEGEINCPSICGRFKKLCKKQMP